MKPAILQSDGGTYFFPCMLPGILLQLRHKVWTMHYVLACHLPGQMQLRSSCSQKRCSPRRLPSSNKPENFVKNWAIYAFLISEASDFVGEKVSSHVMPEDATSKGWWRVASMRKFRSNERFCQLHHDSMTAIFCIAIDIFGLTFQITYLGAAYTMKFKKKT